MRVPLDFNLSTVLADLERQFVCPEDVPPFIDRPTFMLLSKPEPSLLVCVTEEWLLDSHSIFEAKIMSTTAYGAS